MTELLTIDELLRANAKDHPATTALIDAPNRASWFSGQPRRLSWQEIDAEVGALASQFLELGLGSESNVGIQLPNINELVLTLLACTRINAIAVPFPIQHRQHELAYGIGAARITAMVTGARPDRPDQLDSVAEVLATVSDAQMLTFGEAHHSTSSPLRVGQGIERLAPSRASADDIFTICWTSGTTGTPKGVPRSHAMWLAAANFNVQGIGLTDKDRILCPFPLVNMAGIGGMLCPWLMTGSQLVLHQPMDLPTFLDQMANEQITYTVAPPPVLNMLLRNEALLDQVDLSHIRAIASGAAPLDPWMVKGWQDRGIEIVNIFGSNEGAALMSTKALVPDPEDRARFFPRLGRPELDWGVQTPNETRLMDLETGQEILEPGHPGELRFRGPTVFDGYLDSDGEEFDEAGYYRTGDLFELAGDDTPPRFYRFVDRAKDIIIRGGMNISAAEIEALVGSHESVLEVAAVAYPDVDLGERVGLFVVPVPGESPELGGLIDHMRTSDVASYKLPERLELLDALPRNPVGKVVKGELRERWA